MTLVITFRVFVQLESDESSVRILGNLPHLGFWNPDDSVEMIPDGDNWFTFSMEYDPDKQTIVQYRYLILRNLKNVNNDQISVISRWEAHSEPRMFDFNNELLVSDFFGLQSGKTVIDSGWLTLQSEVRLIIRGQNSIDLPNLAENEHIVVKLRPVDLRQCFNPSGKISSSVEAGLHSECKVAVLSSGCTNFSRQPSQGIMYNKGDYVIYKLQTLLANHLTYLFEFFIPKKENYELGISELNELEYIGYSLLLPPTNSVSSCNIDVLSASNSKMGHLTVHYTIVNPLHKNDGNSHHAQSTFIRQWKSTGSLDIGHRGVGKSFEREALARENTIESLNLAAHFNLDFVEFDVQLTKDLVPMLFHDFNFHCKTQSGGSVSSGEESDGDSTESYHELWLKDFSHKDLNNLRLYHLIKATASPALINDTEPVPHKAAFPSLSEVLLNVKDNIGFNVEIKYPMQYMDSNWECERFFDANQYVDRILSVIFKYASPSRRIVFSSFVPEICVMLKLKQNRYPILLLSQGKSERYAPYSDDLCNSSVMAVDFACCNDFLGVSLHSEDLLKDNTPALLCAKRELIWFIWGNDLADSGVRDQFRRMGCNGVIRDDVLCRETEVGLV